MSPHSDDTISNGSEKRSSLILSWTMASSCSEFLDETMVDWLSSKLARTLNSINQVLSCVSYVTCRSLSMLEPQLPHFVLDSACLS